MTCLGGAEDDGRPRERDERFDVQPDGGAGGERGEFAGGEACRGGKGEEVEAGRDVGGEELLIARGEIGQFRMWDVGCGM